MWSVHKILHKNTSETGATKGIYTGTMRPFPYGFAGRREVPAFVDKPDYYYDSGVVQAEDKRAEIVVHTEEEI
jgi:hypothetical protein